MQRNDLAVLAKGMVPFVREVVVDAVTPLNARLTELEARPIEKGDPGERGADGPPGPKGDNGELAMLPPELAEQIASAVRMLHESPEISAKQIPASAGTRVARIERDEDGNFVPVYDQPV